jgi:hypothetical protein
MVAASLTGRRWGPSVSGWLVGLPFTSGPVSLILALEQGTAFTATAAAGFIAGVDAAAAFAVAYAFVAGRLRWPAALVAASAVYLSAAFALRTLSLDATVPLPLIPLYVGTLAVLLVAVRLIPAEAIALETVRPPRWDLPARVVIATTLVVVITTAAPQLGPQLTGLLTTYPIYASVLGAFAHAQRGAAATALVMRGLCFGLFAFSTFFFAIALLIDRGGIAIAFTTAIVAGLSVQSASLVVLRRRALPSPTA